MQPTWIHSLSCSHGPRQPELLCAVVPLSSSSLATIDISPLHLLCCAQNAAIVLHAPKWDSAVRIIAGSGHPTISPKVQKPQLQMLDLMDQELETTERYGRTITKFGEVYMCRVGHNHHFDKYLQQVQPPFSQHYCKPLPVEEAQCALFKQSTLNKPKRRRS